MHRILTVLAAAATFAAPAASIPAAPAPAQSVNGSAQEIDYDSMLRDLETMRRILNKQAFPRNQHPFVDFGEDAQAGGASGRVSEAYYLPGAGALFLANVELCLAPPKEAPSAETTASPTLWEKVRAEVEGRATATGAGSGLDLLFTNQGRGATYQASLVDPLKQAIVQTLVEYGSNLAQIPAEEYLTVLVRGSPRRGFSGDIYYSGGLLSQYGYAAEREAVAGTVTDAGGNPIEGAILTTEASRHSVLSVRIAMRDVRALAGKKDQPEGLPKAAQIAQY